MRKKTTTNSFIIALIISFATSYGQTSALFEESRQDENNGRYVPLPVLRDAPQRVWAKPIMFKDVLKARPSGRGLKIGDKTYSRFETVELGSVYANDEALSELKDATTGKEHIFTGTVLNRRSSFYVIVTSAVEPQTDPNEPSSVIGRILKGSVSMELANHKAQVALVQLLDSIQGEMLLYARQNEIPFKDLFSERSGHSERAIDLIRSSIEPLNYSIEMKPSEILAQLLHISLQEHYSIEGNDEPNIDMPPEAIAAAMAPKKKAITPVTPVLEQLEKMGAAAAEQHASSDPAVQEDMKVAKAQDEDLDSLISALSAKPAVEDNPLKMKDANKPESPVAKEDMPAKPAVESSLLSDIESLLGPEEPSAKAPEVTKPAQPVESDPLMDELDALLQEVESEKETVPAPKALPVEQTKLAPKDSVIKKPILADAPKPADAPKLSDQPIGKKTIAASADEVIEADTPVKKEKRGFFGFGRKKAAPVEEKAVEAPVELASNTLKPLPVKAATPVAAKPVSKDDFEFQFSPIRR
jgi:hypothetical protein